MSTTIARLRPLRLLVQTVLRYRKVGRKRCAVRVAREDKVLGARPWLVRPPPRPRPSIWGRTLALQPARSRGR